MPYKVPEKRREAHRRWREANPEKQRQATRNWHEAHPEKAREQSRRWRKENLERARVREAAYRAANQEARRSLHGQRTRPLRRRRDACTPGRPPSPRLRLIAPL